MPVCVRIRKKYLASFFPSNESSVEVQFSQPQFSATPGQSIVFYLEDVVIGGGIIQTTHKLLKED